MASLKDVSNEILSELSSVTQLPRFIGAAIHSETLDRIFTEGKKSDDSGLGIYALKTIEIKKAEGRFTSNKVNLRHTETLVKSWIWTFENNEAKIGFSSGSRSSDGKTVSNTELIKKLEDQYGEIFDLTPKEDKLIEDISDDFIKGLF